MKHVFTAVCLSAMCAVGLSAQQSAKDTKQSGPDQWTKPMTVTGCLRAGLTAGTFDLTHVKGLPAEHDMATTGTTGTSGSSAATTASKSPEANDTVTLTSEGTVDLGQHVGQEIRVTGRMPKKDSRHITEGAGVDQQSSGGAVSAGGDGQLSSVVKVALLLAVFGSAIVEETVATLVNAVAFCDAIA